MLSPQDYPVFVQKDDGITLSASHDAAHAHPSNTAPHR